MGWLSKLQRRDRGGQGHQDTASISSSTVNTNTMEKNHAAIHPDTKEEELLRKVVRRIMIEEAEKLSGEEQKKKSGLVKNTEALIHRVEEEKAPEPSPPEPAPAAKATINDPRESGSSTATSSRQNKHQRSIQDILDGTAPDEGGIDDESSRSYIHPEIVTNKQFDATVKHVFPGALDNYSLIKQVASMLQEKQGCEKTNTLLATSFCCDEASRQLEDDLEETYGRNFNLGGLAGFPWAGQTGFGAMAHHIPEGGHCLLVYGPHVGITKDGLVGKVERAGIAKPDTCCGSAVAASNYVQEITDGRAMISTNLNSFTDFQQGAVQQMILPHCKRLDEANNRMLELPYALFESQDLLMTTIAENGASATPKGAVLLGGIQINTGPTTPDYFHPLRFSYMNCQGQIVEDWLEEFCERSGSKHDADGRVNMARKSVFAMRPSMGVVSQNPLGRRASEAEEKVAESVASDNVRSNEDWESSEADDGLSEMVVPTAAPSRQRSGTCAQEPGGDCHQSKSIVAKHIDMSGVISENIDM